MEKSMTLDGINKVSEVSLSGHPGQQQGSARKKVLRTLKQNHLKEIAKAAGTDVTTLRRNLQNEVNLFRAANALRPYASKKSKPRTQMKRYSG